MLDPDNPYVLGPHLCAAASELPLTHDDLESSARPRAGARDLVEAGLLGDAPTGWFWTRRERATDLADIRGGRRSRSGSSRCPPAGCSAPWTSRRRTCTVHTGAVYVHQGETYLVAELDLEAEVALLRAGTPNTRPSRGTSPTSR